MNGFLKTNYNIEVEICENTTICKKNIGRACNTAAWAVGWFLASVAIWIAKTVAGLEGERDSRERQRSYLTGFCLLCQVTFKLLFSSCSIQFTCTSLKRREFNSCPESVSGYTYKLTMKIDEYWRTFQVFRSYNNILSLWNPFEIPMSNKLKRMAWFYRRKY